MKKIWGKQSEDKTLNEKGYNIFHLGYNASHLVLIFGTILAYMCATLVCNLVQVLIVILLDPNVGVLSSNHKSFIDFVKNNILCINSLIINAQTLSHLQFGSVNFFIRHGKLISQFLHVIFFIVAEIPVFQYFMKLYTKSRNLNNNEYGSDRIATSKEIKNETYKIPDRYFEFHNSPNPIIMHEFNWKGKLNKTIKTQTQNIQNLLNIKYSEIQRFEFIAKIILFTLIIGLLLGTLIDLNKPYTLIPWFSPLRFLHFLWSIIIDLFTLFKLLFRLLKVLQREIFAAPLYLSTPLVLSEIFGVGYILFKLFPVIRQKIKHSMLIEYVKQKKKSSTKEFEEPQASIIPTESNSSYLNEIKGREKKYLGEASIGHTMQAIYAHPLLSAKLVGLEMLKKSIPIEQGITGYYYLSLQMQNVLLYGITRSGKGQMIINVQNDINSRAENKFKPNMIVNDSKNELSAGTYLTLRKRGYNVLILNIQNTMHSMSYNPLQLVIEYAKIGDISRASRECSQLSYTIYDPDSQGKNKYFYTSAASLFDAIVFSLLAYANGQYYADLHPELAINTTDQDKLYANHDAWNRITITNVLQSTLQLGGEDATKDTTKEASNRLIIYFQHLEAKLQELRNKYAKDSTKLDYIEQNQLAILNQATQKFQQSKMAGKETSGNIYSTFIEKLRIYQEPEVAKMTSMNSINLELLGFDHIISVQFNRAFKVQYLTTEIHLSQMNKPNLMSPEIFEKSNIQLSEIGMAKIPIEKSIPQENFFIVFKIHDERSFQTYKWIIQCKKSYYTAEEVQQLKSDYHKAPIFSEMDITSDGKVIDHFSHKPVLKKIDTEIIKQPNPTDFSEENIGEIKELNSLAYKNKDNNYPELLIKDQFNFLYDERPTALFLITPEQNKELNQLATFIINQCFNVLSDLASSYTKKRHIQRPLQFILDELGQLPPIPDLDQKLSIGLSRWISFLIVFQDKEQLHSIYGDAKAKIIIANCGMTDYILSKSEETLKEISNGFGERTVTVTTKNHDPTKISSTNYNDNEISQKVMPTSRLRHFLPGEIAILRTTDRAKLSGASTEPLPVFDSGKFILPYSWWFLSASFADNISLNSIPVLTPHKYFNIEDNSIPFERIYEQLEKNNPMDDTLTTKIASRILQEITNSNLDPIYIEIFQTKLNSIFNEYTKDESINIIEPLLELEKQVKSYEPIEKLDHILQVESLISDVLRENDFGQNLQIFQIDKSEKFKPIAHLMAFIENKTTQVLQEKNDAEDQREFEKDNLTATIINDLQSQDNASIDKDEGKKYNAIIVLNTLFINYFTNSKILSQTVDDWVLTEKGKALFQNDLYNKIKANLDDLKIKNTSPNQISYSQALLYIFKPFQYYFNLSNDESKDVEFDSQFKNSIGIIVLNRIFNKELINSLIRGQNANVCSYLLVMLNLIDKILNPVLKQQQDYGSDSLESLITKLSLFSSDL